MKSALLLRRKLARFARNADQSIGDLIGGLQLAAGIEPSVIRSPRMALEQWKLALKEVAPPVKGPIAVFAIRNSRWVEWAVFSSCYFIQLGYQPLLVFSGSEIETIYPKVRLPERMGFGFLEGLDAVPHLKTFDLDRYLPPEESSCGNYAEFAMSKAHMVAAYDLKVEEYEGDEEGKYRDAVEAAERMLRRFGKAAEGFFEDVRPRRAVCPSGLIGLSVAVRESADRAGVTSVFVETWTMRPGHNIWSVDKPALEYDIPGWKRALGGWDETKERDARDYMKFREGYKIERDGWLENFHQVQRSKKDAPMPSDVLCFLQRKGPLYLLGTNVVGDSSTLGRATIFRSQKDWICQVVDFFKDHPERNLIIRAHPDEVWQKAAQKIGSVAKNLAKGKDNIFVVEGRADINTFALMEKADVGLAWVSNFGLDMALRGKPVILAAAAQYAYTGLCQTPRTKEEYFESLVGTADHPSPQDEKAVLEGKIYHFIVFKMMSLKSDSENFQTAYYRLLHNGMCPDQDKFFRILVGELSDKGEPLGDGSGKRPPDPFDVYRSVSTL